MYSTSEEMSRENRTLVHSGDYVTIECTHAISALGFS